MAKKRAEKTEEEKFKEKQIEKLCGLLWRWGDLLERTGNAARVNVVRGITEAVHAVEPLKSPADTPSEIIVANSRAFERFAGLQTIGEMVRDNNADIAELVVETLEDGTFAAVSSIIVDLAKKSPLADRFKSPFGIDLGGGAEFDGDDPDCGNKDCPVHGEGGVPMNHAPNVAAFLDQAAGHIQAYLHFGGDPEALFDMVDKFKKHAQPAEPVAP